MRMYGYYAFHSFINQIRKIFKTWVAVFMLICVGMGVVLGLTAAFISDKVDEKQAETAAETEVIEEEETEEYEDEPAFTEEQKMQLFELAVGGIILLILFISAFTADKSVSALFLPADVPILFASPLKPQSVLIFRLCMQIGVMAFSSIYLLVQIPNLAASLDLSAGNAASIVLIWFFTIAWGKLLQVFLYVFGSTHERFKNSLRYILIGILAVIAGGFYVFYKAGGQDILTAADAFFNGKYGLLIPVWGWLRAVIVLGLMKKPLLQLAAVLGNLGAAAAFIYIIWHMRADYYEEAMAKCEETAAILAAAQEGKAARKASKKDRSEKLQRDGLNRGQGADIYFYKAMYNRFRFAHLKYFTKTAETYLGLAVLMSAAEKYFFHTDTLIPVFALLGGAAFFRSLGNALAEDTKTDYFILIPESIWAKLGYSLLGEMANCAMDLIPAMLVSCIILSGNPLTVLFWLALILTVYFYSVSVGAFIDFSVPTSAGQPVKSLVQVLFVYFGILPDAAFLVISALLFSKLWLGMILAIICNCLVGGIFFVISPVFLTNGRK